MRVAVPALVVGFDASTVASSVAPNVNVGGVAGVVADAGPDCADSLPLVSTAETR